jgi:hypothetical protein
MRSLVCTSFRTSGSRPIAACDTASQTVYPWPWLSWLSEQNSICNMRPGRVLHCIRTKPLASTIALLRFALKRLLLLRSTFISRPLLRVRATSVPASALRACASCCVARSLSPAPCVSHHSYVPLQAVGTHDCHPQCPASPDYALTLCAAQQDMHSLLAASMV